MHSTPGPTATPSPSSAPLRLENRHTGEVLELRRVYQDGQVVLDLRGSLPPRSEGPPLHIHHLEDEDGVVTGGTLTALIGGRQIEARAGESVHLPKGVAHRWWNAGDATLTFEGYVRPLVDLDRILQAIFEVVNAAPPGRPSLFYLAHLSLRHRRTHTILTIPRAVQPLLFRVVVAVGTLLGRYRGTKWPGCPARCTGAPGDQAISE